MKISPNPFFENFTLDILLDNTYQVELKIYDLIGQDITFKNFGSSNAGEHALEMYFNANLQSGIYFLEVKMNDISGIYKIIKI